jgi:hypothetical protein
MPVQPTSVELAEPRAADDHEYWVRPPDFGVVQGPRGSSGESEARVDLRFSLAKVSNVDTVAGTAHVKIAVIYYWTDSRLAGWEKGKPLPPKLWGPALILTNSLGDVAQADDAFELVDSATGRLKRSHLYDGTIDNPMDLRDFPFDLDDIELEFRTTSNWESLDSSVKGAAVVGKTYQLCQICVPGEGDWLKMFWSGRIAEFEMQGISSQIHETEISSSGTENTTVTLSVHISRNPGHYFMKALVPLYLLTTLSMTTFHFETDNLSDRNQTVSTYFLAAFAMLYVVGEALPKTDFLTKIDAVIVLTTCSLAFTGIASLALAKVHEKLGQEVADLWNFYVEIGMIVGYVLFNLVIFVPTWMKQRSAIKRLSEFTEAAVSPMGATQVERNDDSETNPMLADGGSSDVLQGKPEYYSTLDTAPQAGMENGHDAMWEAIRVHEGRDYVTLVGSPVRGTARQLSRPYHAQVRET